MSDYIYIANLHGYTIIKSHGNFVGFKETERLIHELIESLIFLMERSQSSDGDLLPIIKDHVLKAKEKLVYPFPAFPKKGAGIFNSGVYFATCDGFPNAIKIGFSEHLKKRLKQHKDDFGNSFNILAFIPDNAPRQLETMFHMYFHDHLLGGEWFSIIPVLNFLGINHD